MKVLSLLIAASLILSTLCLADTDNVTRASAPEPRVVPESNPGLDEDRSRGDTEGMSPPAQPQEARGSQDPKDPKAAQGNTVSGSTGGADASKSQPTNTQQSEDTQQSATTQNSSGSAAQRLLGHWSAGWFVVIMAVKTLENF